jgi:hypothetical protein
MATYNLFLNASQADAAITKAHRLFDQNGLTGQSISLYGGNINNRGTINSTQLYITGGVGQESFINRLTGGIRVAGDSEFDRILNGVDILGTSYIQTLTGGLNVTNGGFNVAGNSVNNGSFRNVGSVSITGPTAITGATRIVGNTDIRGNFYQSGVFDVISTDAEFRGNVDVTGTLDVYGPLRVFGRTTIEATGGLTVSGPSTVIGNSTLQGITNIVGELQLNGEPFITQQINEVTEVNYYLSGSECLTLLELGGGGGVIQTSNTGLVARNQGPLGPGITRGPFSVDLQLTRSSPVQVAAGDHSVLIGGRRNRAVGPSSSAVGGSGNLVSGNASAAMGGSGNWTNGPFSNIFGGQRNYIANQGSNSSILGGGINAALASSSVVLGGYKNQAHRTHSVALGTRAKTYNDTELVQGSQYGQRGWLMGGYNNQTLGSSFFWGDLDYTYTNTGINIPSGITFIKFRICKEETTTEEPSTTVEPTSTTSGPTSTTTSGPTSTTTSGPTSTTTSGPTSTTTSGPTSTTTSGPTSTTTSGPTSTTTSGPTSTTVRPTSTTAAPTSTTAAPTSTTAAPTSTTAAPTSTTAAPTSTTTTAPRFQFNGDLCNYGGNVSIWLYDDSFSIGSTAYVNSYSQETYNGYFVYNGYVYSYANGYTSGATSCPELTTTEDPSTSTTSTTSTTEAPRYSFEGNLCPNEGGNGVTIWLETASFSDNAIAYVNSSGPQTYNGYFVYNPNTYLYTNGSAAQASC